VGPDGRTPRKPIRLIVALAVGLLAIAAIALVLANRGPAPAGTADSGPHTSSVESTASTSEATIEEDASAVVEALNGAVWPLRDRVAGIRVITVLRRPVIEVATDYDAEDAQGAGEFSSQLTGVLAALDSLTGRTYYIRILASGGDIIGVVSRTDARWAIEGPPPPGDSQALYTWLNTVYGSGSPLPELWFGRISAILEPSTDPDGFVVVTTTLDPSLPADRAHAQSIIDAVNSSGATFAPGIRITFSAPDFEWVALLDGVDPFGPDTQ